MASLDSLNDLLTEAARLLDEASSQVRDLQLNPEQNIRKIGEALANISEVRLQVYAQRPDLAPEYLKK